MNPRLKQVLKYAFCTAWGIFALLGLFVLPGIIEFVSLLPLKPSCYFGAEACRQSRGCAALPLPEQAREAELFPMAVEYPKLIGQHSRVVFRASGEWQEAFRKLQSGEKTDSGKQICPMEGEGDDIRLMAFIAAHEWHPFHEGRLHPGGQHFIARRDTSGEFVLIDQID